MRRSRIDTAEILMKGPMFFLPAPHGMALLPRLPVPPNLFRKINSLVILLLRKLYTVIDHFFEGEKIFKVPMHHRQVIPIQDPKREASSRRILRPKSQLLADFILHIFENVAFLIREPVSQQPYCGSGVLDRVCQQLQICARDQP
jgi:hypothetical protein